MTTTTDITLMDELVRDILAHEYLVTWSDGTREITVADDRSIGATHDEPPFRVMVSSGVNTFILGFPSAPAAAQAFLTAIGPDLVLRELQLDHDALVPKDDPRVHCPSLEEAAESLKSLHLRRYVPSPSAPLEPSPLERQIARALRQGVVLEWLKPNGRPIVTYRCGGRTPRGGRVRRYTLLQGRRRRGEGNVRSVSSSIAAADRFVAFLGPERAQAALERALREHRP